MTEGVMQLAVVVCPLSGKHVPMIRALPSPAAVVAGIAVVAGAWVDAGVGVVAAQK